MGCSVCVVQFIYPLSCLLGGEENGSVSFFTYMYDLPGELLGPTRFWLTGAQAIRCFGAGYCEQRMRTTAPRRQFPRKHLAGGHSPRGGSAALLPAGLRTAQAKPGGDLQQSCEKRGSCGGLEVTDAGVRVHPDSRPAHGGKRRARGANGP